MAVKPLILTTYIFCLIGSFLHTLGEQLLNTAEGEVGRGNYTYFSTTYEGPLVLYLHSLSGDADLYVSQIVRKPTYDPDNYCLQSSTCGLDVIHIPANFNRPIGIGVYGHVSHETSKYLLEIYSREDNEVKHSRSIPDKHIQELDYEEHSRKEKTINPGSYSNERRDDEEESFFWTVIWSVFDILLEVVFL